MAISMTSTASDSVTCFTYSENNYLKQENDYFKQEKKIRNYTYTH